MPCLINNCYNDISYNIITDEKLTAMYALKLIINKQEIIINN